MPHNDRTRRASTQRIELSALAEEEICQAMGWKRMPDNVKAALHSWCYRFFDMGAASQADTTIQMQLERDTALARVEALEKVVEHLRDEIATPEYALHVDRPFDKDE